MQINKSNNVDSFLNANRVYVIGILIILTVLQQMPVVRDNAYQIIRILLYTGFAITSIRSIIHIKNYTGVRLTNRFVATVVYSVSLFFISSFIVDEASDSLEIVIAFGIYLSVLHSPPTKSYETKLATLYIALATILGITSVLYYGDGLSISPTYFLSAKNQVGTIIGLSAIMIYIRIVNNSISNIVILLLRSLTLLSLILSMLLLRNRSGLIALFIIMVLLFFRSKIYMKNYINLSITLASLMLMIVLYYLKLLDPLIKIVTESLFLNFDSTNINMLTSDRMTGYSNALTFIKDNIFFGELSGHKYTGSTPHNYLLLKITKYGILGAFPLIVMYLYLWRFAISNILSKRKSGEVDFSVWLLLYSLLISLVEYTYPYGPGITQVFVWYSTASAIVNKRVDTT